MMSQINAVILAGSRPGGDPLADLHGVPVKALVPVADKPMFTHVAKKLTHHSTIDQVQILAQEPTVFTENPDCDWVTTDEHVTFVASSSTIAGSLDDLLAGEAMAYPMLITTADNVLLDHSMIDHFVTQATGSDIAIAAVEKSVLMADYPQSKRTWLKFRGGHFSGANLFYFGSPRARQILRYWAEVEQDRKKGWRVLSIFGLWLLIQVLLGRLTVRQFAERLSRKLNLDIQVVEMQQAEACIDVDTQSDLDLVEDILAMRHVSL